ncbi:MAG TPA: type II secretion system protein N [Variovorax sp.]|nr:type II secretion system protein N [Variovorax sp.]
MTLSYPTARWPAAVATFGLWTAAAAVVVFWGLRLAAPPDAAPPPVVAAPQTGNIDPTAVARLLGAVTGVAPVASAPEAAGRFALLGVVADNLQRGVALIAVDGQPPRPFRVGGRVAEGHVLQSVGTRSAVIGTGGGTGGIALQLPTTPMAIPAPPSQR